MKILEHYHLSYWLAKQLGFDDETSRIIAHSSQQADDFRDSLFIEFRDGRPPLAAPALQTTDITRDHNVNMFAWMALHFMPGDLGADDLKNPPEDKTRRLVVTPGSENAKTLVRWAHAKIIKSDAESLRLMKYLLGLAWHMYLDTFTHQNFIGGKHEANKIDAHKIHTNIINTIIPEIGHAEAMHDPDLINKNWCDTRLNSEMICNRVRYKRAFESLFELMGGNGKPIMFETKWDMITGGLTYYNDEKIIIERIDAPKYNKDEWTNYALDTRIAPNYYRVDHRLADPDKFDGSHLDNFLQAARLYLEQANQIIAPLVRDAGLM